MKDPERILLVRMSHLGDVVCALPVFHALREAHPQAEIGWVVQPEFSGLLEGLPGLQHLFHFERRGGLGAWPRLWGRLRSFGADLAVDAQGNLKSAAALWCSGAPRRVGLDRGDWREPSGARVLTDTAPPCGAPHAIDRMLALARHVAPGIEQRRFDPGLAEAELQHAREELARLFPDGARGARLLHLARPQDVRSWPPERFADLARRLRDEGAPVALVSGPEEEEEGLRLARELGGEPIRHLVGQRDTRRLAALMTAVAEQDGLMVSSDSGPMHLACACGLATLCLEGPQDEARTGPWTPAGPAPLAVLRAARQPECAPCLRRRCHHREGPVCMTGLEVDAVASAARPRETQAVL